MGEKAVILLDGGYVTKRLRSLNRRFPTPADIVGICTRVMSHPRLDRIELLRAFFYDAPPATGVIKNPVDGTRVNLATTAQNSRQTALLDALALEPDFAIRLGVLAPRGWEVGRRALRELSRNPRHLEAEDLVPKLTQKGVDSRISLDIAWTALKKNAAVIVLVAGDSDLIPAMKLARAEGAKVYLDPLGFQGVRADLKEHADYVF